MHLTIRRDTIIVVSGEEMNVSRCVEALKDMGEEVEMTMKLPSEQIHALLAHEGKYRKRIEQDSRVYVALDGVDGIRVSGGPKAVKSAERSITDLFRSESWRVS